MERQESLIRTWKWGVASPAGSQDPSDESADNRRAQRHPAGTMSVMVIDLVVTVMSWCRSTFGGMMPWSRFGRMTFTSMWSRHCGSAERYTGKSEYHKLFESLLHSAPSFLILDGCCIRGCSFGTLPGNTNGCGRNTALNCMLYTI
jgi:hypothetical protein